MDEVVAKSNDDGTISTREIDPHDREALAKDPELQGEGVGKLRIENDDQVMLVFTLDKETHARQQQAFLDAAALAQEHMIPHKPYDGPKDED